MQTRKAKVYHECAIGCSKCYGTGEGWYENSNCTNCHGTGLSWSRGELEEEFEVEWSKDDLSDLEISNGYYECPECGQDLYKCAREALVTLLDEEMS